MRIHIRSETEVDLSQLHEAGFEVSSEESAPAFGAMQMFAAAVAMCTHAVLASYGQRCGAPADGIRIRVRWRYAERPKRIESLDMDVRWPQLPDSRLDAATRAAHQCTLHNTLGHGVEVSTLVDH